MPARGLKAKIAFNVSFLLLLSAIITDVLVILIVQNVMVRAEVAQQQRFIEQTGRLFLTPLQGSSEKIIDEKQGAMSLLLGQSNLPAVLLADRVGHYLYRQYSDVYSQKRLHKAIADTFQKHEARQENLGLTWAVFWWGPRAVLIASPLYEGTQLRGSIAAIVALTPIYEKLRIYNKPIFLYIIINTGLLTILGLYRIFKIYLRPIDRIVRQADDYREDEDLFFAFRREDNELNRLSLALNRMLIRIATDKQKLKEAVTSLERANLELKQAQNEVIRAEKMASVGRLAAGIAHEIGNPIGIVLGYIDLLKQSDLDADEKKDFLQRVEKEIQRINTVIRQLLDLARPKVSQSQQISVHSVIEDIVEVMRVQPLMAEISVTMQLRAAVDAVWVDAEQLRQVFLNLLLNAADAIRSAAPASGGCITICTTLDTTTAPEPPAQWLIVAFQDNGTGIAPDQMETIFDPFYTSKEPGKGTGLGLAVSYMIVEQMGGDISAQSRLGQGTTMTIRLPLKAD